MVKRFTTKKVFTAINGEDEMLKIEVKSKEILEK